MERFGSDEDVDTRNWMDGQVSLRDGERRRILVFPASSPRLMATLLIYFFYFSVLLCY